jgi:hypothetical protein
MLTENAAERYKDLIALIAPGPRPALSAASLQQVIEDANGNASQAVAEHVAASTPLTAAQVKPAVDAALSSLPEHADSAQAAEATSQAVNELVPSVNLELNEAVMLNGTVRAVFAAFYSVLSLCGIGAIVIVGTEASPSETTLIALVVLTVLAFVITLVLVMGYKSVKAKIEPASA